MKNQQEFRVACPKGMQHATLNTINTTTHATKAQPESLKALVERRFRRNTPCNNNATPPLKRAQLPSQISPKKIARVAGKDTHLDNAIEAAEERAANMEYEGCLSRAEVEKQAIQVHLKPYHFTTTDGGGICLIDGSLDQAREALMLRFGKKLVSHK